MIQPIKIVFTDCDGVLTDNRVYQHENGQELLCFHKADGIAVSALRDIGIKVVIVTGERSSAVVRRAEKLHVECWQVGADHSKQYAVESVLAREGLSWKDAAYIGNDETDVYCLFHAAIGILPADHIVPGLNSGRFSKDEMAIIATLSIRGGAGVLYAALPLLRRK